jgi:hypothetical protein
MWTYLVWARLPSAVQSMVTPSPVPGHTPLKRKCQPEIDKICRRAGQDGMVGLRTKIELRQQAGRSTHPLVEWQMNSF